MNQIAKIVLVTPQHTLTLPRAKVELFQTLLPYNAIHVLQLEFYTYCNLGAGPPSLTHERHSSTSIAILPIPRADGQAEPFHFCRKRRDSRLYRSCDSAATDVSASQWPAYQPSEIIVTLRDAIQMSVILSSPVRQMILPRNVADETTPMFTEINVVVLL